MFMFSAESGDRCLLTIYPAEVKSRTQGTDVAGIKNPIFTGKASSLMRITEIY